MAALRPNFAISVKLGKHTWQMKYIPYLGFQGQGTWSGGSWCSVGWGKLFAHCTMGMQSHQKRRFSVVDGPYNNQSNGVTTTGGRPTRPHSRHWPHLHSLISSHPFHVGGAQDRCGATYLPTWSHSSTTHGLPSLVPLPPPFPQFLSFPPRRSAHFDTAEVLAVKANLGGDHTDFCQRVYLPGVLLPPELRPLILMPFWWTVETRWSLVILTPTIPPSQPRRMTGQRAEGELLMGRSTVHSSQLRTKTSLLVCPPRARPPRQISPFCAGISFPMWRGLPSLPLGLTNSPKPSPSLVVPRSHRGRP